MTKKTNPPKNPKVEYDTMRKGDTFNDSMVKKTVLPAIYLWLLAAGAVVAMGIWKPNVVLENIEGFIALIAIIGGVAAPALQTVLRMWEAEQTIEIDNMGVEMEHDRQRDAMKKEHVIAMEKSEQIHQQALLTSAQEHEQIVEKHKETIVKLTPIHKMNKE